MNEKQTTKTKTSIDPICGMGVMPATAAGSLIQDGQVLYFCSAGCLQKFMEASGKPQKSCCTAD